MNFWRMQLHPDERESAAEHTVKCLAAGLIGFGFRKDPGDLTLIDTTEKLPPYVKLHDVEFATVMTIGDKVLVYLHNYPFALATVASDYNYVKQRDRDLLGV